MPKVIRHTFVAIHDTTDKKTGNKLYRMMVYDGELDDPDFEGHCVYMSSEELEEFAMSLIKLVSGTEQ